MRADIGGPPDQIARGASFDAVSAFDVLFHIVDDAAYGRAFQNIASLLKPGGWFLWSDNFLKANPRSGSPIRPAGLWPRVSDWWRQRASRW